MDKYSKLVVGIKVDIQRTDGRWNSIHNTRTTKTIFFLGLSKIDDQPTFCIHNVVVVTWILTSEWCKLCYFIFSVFGILLHGWSERYFTFWQWTGCLVLWGAESHLCLSGLGSAEECNKRLLHKDQPMTYPRMVTECTLVRAFVISQDQCWLLAHFYNYFVHSCNIEREVFVNLVFILLHSNTKLIPTANQACVRLYGTIVVDPRMLFSLDEEAYDCAWDQFWKRQIFGLTLKERVM